ncbi:hypothetical protein QBC34DRAFT_165130 [Podospora aff. communis PSN243]|uniref:Uncharacterized protein n=1 Tax=Podospora aff. communis PSN243 TaxID=3040156 RepID=A0AAV9G8T4_9PEZI|nr:hypothetical protein QBC34DRAFT_165130 [Podospora aff. communis PSN243]
MLILGPIGSWSGASAAVGSSRPHMMSSGLTRFLDVFRPPEPPKFLNWLAKSELLTANSQSFSFGDSDDNRRASSAYGTFDSAIPREATDQSLCTLVDSSTQGHPQQETKQGPHSVDSTGTTNNLLVTGVPLPGSNDRIWLGRPVHSAGWSVEEYEEHYEYVIGELKKAVDEHKTLRADGLIYSQRMVGTSAETSAPAIVVSCHKDDEHALRSWFGKCISDGLHCRVKTRKSRRSANKKSSGKAPAQHDNKQPPRTFDIVIFPRPGPPLIRRAAETVVLERRAPNNRSLCGSLAHFNRRSATLGVSLQIGDVVRVLTVDHLFEPKPRPGTMTDTGYTIIGRSLLQGTASRVQPPVRLSNKSAYLDWGLVEPQRSALSHNLIMLDEGKNPTPLRDFAPPPLRQTQVYMISGLHGLRHGTLLGGLSHISTQKGRALCPALTFVLESGVVENGECGSVIADRATFQVFGHVVGADAELGLGYIVPITETLEQIKTAFHGSDVKIFDATAPKNPTDQGAVGSTLAECTDPSTAGGEVADEHSPSRLSGSVSGSLTTMVSKKARSILTWPSLSLPLLVPIFAVGTFIPPILLSLPVTTGWYDMPTTSPSHTSVPIQHFPRGVDAPKKYQPSVDGFFDRDMCVAKYLQKGLECGNSPVPVFEREPDHSLTSPGVAMTISIDGCERLCGSAPDTAYYLDAGPRFMTWILPILLLLSNIELTAINKRRLYACVQVLGDPVGTLWSLLDKFQALSRCLELAYSTQMNGLGWGTDHYQASIVATVLAGFEEAAGPSRCPPQLLRDLVEQFQPTTTDLTFMIWRESAQQLSDSRPRNWLPACIAGITFVFDLLSAFFFIAKDGRVPTGGILPLLSLSFLLPAALLSSPIGASDNRPVMGTLLRFIQDARHAARLESDHTHVNSTLDKLEAALDVEGFRSSRTWDQYFQSLSFVGGGRNLYRPILLRDTEPNHYARLKWIRSGKFGRFLLAACPVLGGLVGTLAVVAHSNFSQLSVLLVLYFWILGAVFTFALRTIADRPENIFLRRNRHHAALVVHLCTGVASSWFLFRAARQPLAGDLRSDEEIWRVFAISLGVVLFHLLFTLGVMGLYWKGISAVWRSKLTGRKMAVESFWARARLQRKDFVPSAESRSAGDGVLYLDK